MRLKTTRCSSNFYPLLSLVMVGIVLESMSGSLLAQASAASNQISRLTNRDVRNYSVSALNQRDINAGRYSLSSVSRQISPIKKPFSNVQSRSTVSPYLSLFNEGFSNSGDNYNTLVRPQLDQQRINQQTRRQEQAINARFQSLSAKPAFSPQGNQNILSTGHPTTYFNLSHYYPQAGR